MASIAARLELKGLGKQKFTALTAKAKRLGMTPARYLRQLVDDDLELDRQAQATTFSQLMGTTRDQFKESGLTEQELDDLVNAARSRHHNRVSGTRRKG
jgi:hypothetical protein